MTLVVKGAAPSVTHCHLHLEVRREPPVEHERARRAQYRTHTDARHDDRGVAIRSSDGAHHPPRVCASRGLPQWRHERRRCGGAEMERDEGAIENVHASTCTFGLFGTRAFERALSGGLFGWCRRCVCLRVLGPQYRVATNRERTGQLAAFRFCTTTGGAAGAWSAAERHRRGPDAAGPAAAAPRRWR